MAISTGIRGLVTALGLSLALVSCGSRGDAAPVVAPSGQAATSVSGSPSVPVSPSVGRTAVSPPVRAVKANPPAVYKPSWPSVAVKTSGGYLVDKCVPKALYPNVVSLTTSDHVHLSALVLGSGRNGVVLSHEQGYNICSFLDLGQKLAARGYQVILPEFRNHGASQQAEDNDHIQRDGTAALTELRRRGAKRIFVGGASAGGTVSAVIGASDPGLVGLLIMSSPAKFIGVDGDAAVRKITAPTLMIVSPGDMNGAVERQVRTLYAASASPHKKLIVNTSGYHGTDMFRKAKDGAATETTVLRFVVAAFT